MRKRTLTSTVSALGLFAIVGLIAALALSISWPNLARAHTAADSALTRLTVTPGTLTPAFSSTVYFYTVPVADTVTQITIEGRADGDGTVAYQDADGTLATDADANTAGQQVNIPAGGGKRINVVVSHTDSGATTTQTYGVLVIRERPVATDTIALMALYNSADGANWTTNTNWGSSLPLDNWHGVTTDADGRVTDLELDDNNLVGTLPSELRSLTSLTSLMLSENKLSGNIPNLSGLSQLEHLDLGDNQLNGTLPGWLGDLTTLEVLSLGGNQFNGTIPNLGNLTNLRELHLDHNELSGAIPRWVSDLSNLEQLYLDDNQLRGTVPDLSRLTNLTELSLSGNPLSGPFPDVSRLTNLQKLNLGRTQLSGAIPRWVGDLTTLEQLYLDDNQLSGPIPDLSRLTNLRELHLNHNELSGKIPDLSDLINLEQLYLDDNQLHGTIPNWMGNLTNLEELSLWGNQLSGSIPNLSRLTNLTVLSLFSNQFSGDIPSSLGSLTSLEQLFLQSNKLVGAIPTSLGNLTSLKYLRFDHNGLGEPIPDLSSLTNLEQLYLDDNQLSGTIPDLSPLSKLEILSLHSNMFTGEIPASLGSLSLLELLSLRNNMLTGEIPEELGSLTALEVTRFAGNALTGCVPHGLRYLMDAANIPPGIPAHDFRAVDANGDGDTDHLDDTPGLKLPFCLLSELAFSDVTLVPAFAKGTTTYTASAANDLASTTVTVTLNDDGDRLSIKKGTNSYTNGASVPLDVGPNEITIEVTPADATLTQTYTVQVFRAGTVASDRAALMALYNSTGGPNWTTNTNWGTDALIDDWYGVRTNSGRVSDIDLPTNNLSGTIPVELRSLTELLDLDLSGNRLRGNIPDLSGLTELRDVNLRGNQLSGPIPALRGFDRLTTLVLSSNRLSGEIPASLGDLPLLQHLYLNSNQLRGTIPEALNLIALRATRFAGNSLTGCVPDRLRDILDESELEPGVPAHDFIAVDANGDGDTNDAGDTPGLNLPFCTISELTIGGATLEPAFANDTTTYTASIAHDVESTTVTARLYEFSDTVSIIKGTDTYTSGASVPLDVGWNLLTIKVTPSDGTPAPPTYTVTVTRRDNARPVFNEGAATKRGITENTAAGKNIGVPITATDTEGGDTLTYSLDNASAEIFDIVSTTGQLQTKAALDYETKRSYTLTVSVRDSKDDNGNPDERTDNTITVTVLISQQLERSEFLEEAYTRTIPENTAAGVNIGDPVVATLGDIATLTYFLQHYPERFDIDAASGQLRTLSPLNFETKNSYSLTVFVLNPSGDLYPTDVTLTVTDVEEAGTVRLSSVQPVFDTPLTATLTDPDGSESGITWLWQRSLNRTSWTTISGANSATYSPVASDVGRFLRVTASYIDRRGPGKSAQAVSTNPVRTQVPGNFPPFLPLNQTRTIAENTPAGVNIGAPIEASDDEDETVTYSLDLSNADTFDIGLTSGQLKTKAPLDHETRRSYSVQVTATDPSGDSGTRSGTRSVTINVLNVEEPGTVTFWLVQPQVGTELDAYLDDPDGGEAAAASWLWERSSDRSNWVPVSGTTTAITTRTTYTPVASDVGYYLRATASYKDFIEPGKSAQGVSTHAVQVAPGLHAPVFTEGATATRTASKNTQAGVNIGAPIAATDGDNDCLTYSLSGPDAESFNIVASSGQLLTKAPLDRVYKRSYSVYVNVHDGRRDNSGRLETNPMIDATIRVTINISSGGSGGSGGNSGGNSGGGNSDGGNSGGGNSGGGNSGGGNSDDGNSDDSNSDGSGGGGGGGDGDGDEGRTATVATPILTPIEQQFSGQIIAGPTVTGTVVPEGNTVGVHGGANVPGGVYVNFPPGAVGVPVGITVSVSNTALRGVEAPCGTILLPLTIDIIPETPTTLGQPVTIEIYPITPLVTAAGSDLNKLTIGVVTSSGIQLLPVKVVNGRLVVTTDQLSTFVLFVVNKPVPSLTQPPMGDASSMSPLLQWTQPFGTTWFQVQVIPFNNDGIGIDLIIGDLAQVQAAQYQVKAPSFGSADPNYVLLPDMTYFWRVRTTSVATNPTEADWCAWSVRSFKTPPTSTSTISRVAPEMFGQVSTRTPTLTWTNSNTRVFYYEVQVSKDHTFGPNAFLYSEYVHGGVSSPLNSYVIPDAFPLEADQVYNWRVRPRIQGDGTPLPWSATYVFQVVNPHSSPTLTQPPWGDASSMGPLLQWRQAANTTWFQVQVVPYNNDGVGIDLIIGDRARVRAAQYQVMAPRFGSADPNYVMLPDMTYVWRVRTTSVLTTPTEADWSAWATNSFRTPPASTSTISRVAPDMFGQVSTRTPTLTWTNSNTGVFYYEVQVSKDIAFGPNAFLYSEYVHGGASSPPNSYMIPAAYPLELGEFYYWRVRPRIQGDGTPLPWSDTYMFQVVNPNPSPTLTQPPSGDASSMGPLLQWTQSPGTTWFQVQVIPFNNDGVGIDLIIGDSAQVQAAQYQVMAPSFGSADPNYVMLPDMTYLWRVRTASVLTNPTEADWSAWATSSFRTPTATSSTISRVAPEMFGPVTTRTPTLTWTNSNTNVFYYEVQVSNINVFAQNAFLYNEYVHGGVSSPLNSYVIPDAFPLQTGAIYYWRVRPRIQGDGTPLPWSATYVFLVPLSVGHGQ